MSKASCAIPVEQHPVAFRSWWSWDIVPSASYLWGNQDSLYSKRKWSLAYRCHRQGQRTWHFLSHVAGCYYNFGFLEVVCFPQPVFLLSSHKQKGKQVKSYTHFRVFKTSMWGKYYQVLASTGSRKASEELRDSQMIKSEEAKLESELIHSESSVCARTYYDKLLLLSKLAVFGWRESIFREESWAADSEDSWSCAIQEGNKANNHFSPSVTSFLTLGCPCDLYLE